MEGANGGTGIDDDSERLRAAGHRQQARDRAESQGHDGVCPDRPRRGRRRGGPNAAADRGPDLRQCQGRHAVDAGGSNPRHRPAAESAGLAGRVRQDLAFLQRSRLACTPTRARRDRGADRCDDRGARGGCESRNPRDDRTPQACGTSS